MNDQDITNVECPGCEIIADIPVAGFIFSPLGRMPKEGDYIMCTNCNATLLIVPDGMVIRPFEEGQEYRRKIESSRLVE